MSDFTHAIDIPREHPGLVDEENPRSLLIGIVYWKIEQFPKEGLFPEPDSWPLTPSEIPGYEPDVYVVLTAADSCELAAFLHRNTHPPHVIKTVESFGPVDEPPERIDVISELAEKHDAWHAALEDDKRSPSNQSQPTLPQFTSEDGDKSRR